MDTRHGARLRREKLDRYTAWEAAEMCGITYQELRWHRHRNCVPAPKHTINGSKRKYYSMADIEELKTLYQS